MPKQAALAADAVLQQRATAVGDALGELARDGIDAVVTADGTLLLGRAQAAISQSDARYRHLINRMGAMVVEFDPGGRLLYLNAVAAAASGYDDTTAASADWFALLLPVDDGVAPAELRQQFLRGGELVDFRTCFRGADRLPRIVNWNSAQVRDAKGTVERLICFGTDITERVRIEQELRIAAHAFESQLGMVVTDADNVILRVNRAFTNLTGYTAAEAIGQTPALLKSGRHGGEFYRRMWETLEREHYWQGEVWNRRKNGKIYAEWLTISAVLDERGGVTNYIAAFSDITKNKEAEAEIHRLAFYDPLTNLPNRRLLTDRVGQALLACVRSGAHGAILFIDLDDFKTLNDTRGHEVGDMLLIEVANRLQSCVREGDTVSRMGGDEFVVMLENLSAGIDEAAAHAVAVAEKIRAAMNQPYCLRDRDYHSTPSIGITLFRDDSANSDTLLKRADAAMYLAKNAGRNTSRFFDPAMQSAIEARAQLGTELRHALPQGQLELYYQAQTDAGLGIVGAEVLLRWHHPEQGMVPPGRFIPLAEETGLIVPIGQWVMESACRQLKVWENVAATSHLQLAVNVSARQFRLPEFVATVRQILERSGANPARLKLELTESLVLHNVEDSIAKMRELKHLGAGFSMDDFGTGYSSLSYLHRLPLDQLKIDQSFVRDLSEDNADAVIVQTIITMGKTLGLNVIAEGVETELQRAFLEQNGCPTYQGYLCSRPLPLADFESFIAR